jgi:NAD-dependent DNA ligase
MMTEIEGRKLAKNLFLLGFEEFNVTEICEVLKLADDFYENTNEGDPIFSDSDYDTLKRFAERVDPTNPYFLGVGSDVRGGKVNLPFEMGSLNQVFHGEIIDWIKKWKLYGYYGVISHKLDGTSGMVIYDNTGKFQIAYSRGNGRQGADISRHLSQMPSVPKQFMANIAMTVRGENIISKSNFIKAQ